MRAGVKPEAKIVVVEVTKITLPAYATRGRCEEDDASSVGYPERRGGRQLADGSGDALGQTNMSGGMSF